jgi:hypothetical protein
MPCLGLFLGVAVLAIVFFASDNSHPNHLNPASMQPDNQAGTAGCAVEWALLIGFLVLVILAGMGVTAEQMLAH